MRHEARGRDSVNTKLAIETVGWESSASYTTRGPESYRGWDQKYIEVFGAEARRTSRQGYFTIRTDGSRGNRNKSRSILGLVGWRLERSAATMVLLRGLPSARALRQRRREGARGGGSGDNDERTRRRRDNQVRVLKAINTRIRTKQSIMAACVKA